ncbi:MAG: amino acid racemase [Candidatus Heimdallarchaeota archaeon]|nr:amino acid racemase [Candidatus Heimdallarchaeota archaeon]MCK4290393.1 amino acid racemase [Candidatus Heimdallarchaeota archaeon]
MKKIGIIGGLSFESTLEYYKIIARSYNKIVGGAASPNLVIDSLDLQKVTDWFVNDEWDKVLEELVSSANNLIAAKAEVIILATNTPHIVFNKLEKKVSKPMISIMDATAREIKKQNLKKIGLIGTKFTMQGEYYPKAFEKFDLEIIAPSLEDQEIIHEIIYKELTFHVLNETSREKYLEIIYRLHEKGAEGVILGCTEIPLLIKQEDCKIPVFDTATIHALSVLRYAMND